MKSLFNFVAALVELGWEQQKVVIRYIVSHKDVGLNLLADISKGIQESNLKAVLSKSMAETTEVYGEAIPVYAEYREALKSLKATWVDVVGEKEEKEVQMAIELN